MARGIYREVTDTILAQLEKGVRPWQRPWETGVEAEKPAPTLPLRHNGEPYRGTNVVLLWSAASERGYDKPTWMTYRQAQELGGSSARAKRAFSSPSRRPGRRRRSIPRPEPRRRRRFRS